MRLEFDSNATQMWYLFQFAYLVVLIFTYSLFCCFRSSLDELYVKHVRWRRFSVISWWKKVFQSVHPSFYSILQRHWVTNIRASLFQNIIHCRWCAQEKQTTTMPQNDALLKAVESLSNQILSFHNDFKQSFYYLVDTINPVPCWTR